MRTLVLTIAIAFLLSPAAAASVPHPQALVIDRVGGAATLLTWTPLAGASSYTILKGTSADSLHPVEQTSLTFFLDMDAQPDVIYEVIGHSIFGEQAIEGPASGDCVSTSSDFRVSVSAENCLKGI